MKKTSIEKIRKELIEKFKNDSLNMAKVERYISFLNIDSKCDEEIERDGTTICTENGPQKFYKQHPAITTKLEISEKIEKLEITLGLTTIADKAPAPSTSATEGKSKASLL